jgi:hypothetical protein
MRRYAARLIQRFAPAFAKGTSSVAAADFVEIENPEYTQARDRGDLFSR